MRRVVPPHHQIVDARHGPLIARETRPRQHTAATRSRTSSRTRSRVSRLLQEPPQSHSRRLGLSALKLPQPVLPPSSLGPFQKPIPSFEIIHLTNPYASPI